MAFGPKDHSIQAFGAILSLRLRALEFRISSRCALGSRAWGNMGLGAGAAFQGL